MKKALLLIVAATIMLASCGKENVTVESLNGTTWKSETFNGNMTMELTFFYNNMIGLRFAKFTDYVNGREEITQTFSYTLNYPNIEFRYGQEEDASYIGLFIDENSFKYGPNYEDNYLTTFHRQ